VPAGEQRPLPEGQQAPPRQEAPGTSAKALGDDQKKQRDSLGEDESSASSLPSSLPGAESCRAKRGRSRDPPSSPVPRGAEDGRSPAQGQEKSASAGHQPQPGEGEVGSSAEQASPPALGLPRQPHPLPQAALCISETPLLLGPTCPAPAPARKRPLSRRARRALPTAQRTPAHRGRALPCCRPPACRAPGAGQSCGTADHPDRARRALQAQVCLHGQVLPRQSTGSRTWPPKPRPWMVMEHSPASPRLPSITGVGGSRGCSGCRFQGAERTVQTCRASSAVPRFKTRRPGPGSGGEGTQLC